LSQQTTFPPESFYNKNYETRQVTLTSPKPLSIVVYGDFLDVIETNADLDKVYIWFNIQDSNPRVRLSRALGVQTPFSKIILDWEDTEDGKYITLLVGKDFSFRILRGIITLAQDLVGLARESTLVATKRNEELTYIPPQNVHQNGDSGANPLIINYGSVVVFFLNVSSVGGTDSTLDVYIDIQDPASGNWVNQDKFPQVTTAGIWALALPVRAVKYRVRWVLGGTNPSFTFSIGVVIVK
jgi:hypothetical protein